MAGKLFLCATPIGNLGDITERTLECLRQVDMIAAEDTRNSMKLITHFDIHTPLTSYHEHNKDRITQDHPQEVPGLCLLPGERGGTVSG